MAGWFSCPVSPGFHPGLLVPRPSRTPKKPPAGAGGLRVAHLPMCHAKRLRTGESPAVVWHGWRDGVHARCPRVSTRGFLCHARHAPPKSPRREPGDSGSHDATATAGRGRPDGVCRRRACGRHGGSPCRQACAAWSRPWPIAASPRRIAAADRPPWRALPPPSRSAAASCRTASASRPAPRPPPTTGEDQPRPGSGVFQRTFSVSLHVTGRSWAASACPCPAGPRHCGHGSAEIGGGCEERDDSRKIPQARFPNAGIPPACISGAVCDPRW